MILLHRFSTYVTELGIIDNPPDYMFIDWIFIDGFSMHHPPKSLGQSCLNMFYYGALDYAKKIYSILGEDAMAKDAGEKMISLKENINRLLFDEEKGIYFEGLNHSIPEDMVCEWEQPQNTDKRYYLPHSNILACCYGVADGDRARSIIEKVMEDKKHYLSDGSGKLSITESNEKYSAGVISPIIAEGDIIGNVIVIQENETDNITETELKLANAASMFLAKQMEI
jgi:hypothetical protein